MVIELLYFEGCPGWRKAWHELGDALAASGLDAEVRLRDVARLTEGELVGFAGSPSIRIDGRDLEGYAGPGVMACRVYPANGGRAWPNRDRLRDGLELAAKAAP